MLVIFSPHDIAYKVDHIYPLYSKQIFRKSETVFKKSETGNIVFVCLLCVQVYFVLNSVAMSGDEIFLKCILIVFL